ncbi:hypothetical protein DPEC_G00090390 [Dallia pectoralis]|uniref:Uncharacterized protein n=1 Tax=Dallia pectoralis TaxID=75939 RepID=A0ACC2H0N6_DALPE|nr:hypothetical protein DPEC_G00090390 [Dallia pectoralis]
MSLSHHCRRPLVMGIPNLRAVPSTKPINLSRRDGRRVGEFEESMDTESISSSPLLLWSRETQEKIAGVYKGAGGLTLRPHILPRKSSLPPVPRSQTIESMPSPMSSSPRRERLNCLRIAHGIAQKICCPVRRLLEDAYIHCLNLKERL